MPPWLLISFKGSRFFANKAQWLCPDFSSLHRCIESQFSFALPHPFIFPHLLFTLESCAELSPITSRENCTVCKMNSFIEDVYMYDSVVTVASLSGIIRLIYSTFMMLAWRNLTRISLKTLTSLANSYYWPATWEKTVLSGSMLHVRHPHDVTSCNVSTVPRRTYMLTVSSSLYDSQRQTAQSKFRHWPSKIPSTIGYH